MAVHLKGKPPLPYTAPRPQAAADSGESKSSVRGVEGRRGPTLRPPRHAHRAPPGARQEPGAAGGRPSNRCDTKTLRGRVTQGGTKLRIKLRGAETLSIASHRPTLIRDSLARGHSPMTPHTGPARDNRGAIGTGARHFAAVITRRALSLQQG